MLLDVEIDLGLLLLLSIESFLISKCTCFLEREKSESGGHVHGVNHFEFVLFTILFFSVLQLLYQKCPIIMYSIQLDTS